MGTPRETIRIVEENGENRLVQPSTREDVTEKMEQFSNDFLQTIPDVDGFILKNRSPSCGTRDVKIYSVLKKRQQRERSWLIRRSSSKNFRIFLLKRKVDCRILLLESISLQGYLQSHITK